VRNNQASSSEKVSECDGSRLRDGRGRDRVPLSRGHRKKVGRRGTEISERFRSGEEGGVESIRG